MEIKLTPRVRFVRNIGAYCGEVRVEEGGRFLYYMGGTPARPHAVDALKDAIILRSELLAENGLAVPS